MRLLSVVLAAVLFAAPLHAGDVWALRGGVGPCEGLQWQADVLLFNSSAAPATVGLISMSDGRDDATPRELVVPPRQTVSIGRTTSWTPAGAPPFWMLHLDVPPAVVVEGALNLGTGTGGCVLVPTPDRAALYGTQRIPHFRTLVPAGEEQIHLNTTLGGIASRSNAGIHNAGSAAASARVELRRACDNQLLDAKTVTIAAMSTVQVRLEGVPGDACTAAHRDVQPWVGYITIVVDQPSLSWVSTLANGVEPRVLTTVR